MRKENIESVTQAISPKRLAAYRKTGDTEVQVLARYVWNIRLSEALYPALHNLEVVLRNNVNKSIGDSYQDPDWLHEQCAFLGEAERHKVREAAQDVPPERALDQDRLVAELPFGFWCSLFNASYEHVIWRRKGVLRSAFPLMPQSDRTRDAVSRRLNFIRKRLRNRVFHHEAIHGRPNLCREYQSILEAIEWMNPTMRQLTVVIDGFDTICTKQYYERLVEILEKEF